MHFQSILAVVATSLLAGQALGVGFVPGVGIGSDDKKMIQNLRSLCKNKQIGDKCSARIGGIMVKGQCGHSVGGKMPLTCMPRRNKVYPDALELQAGARKETTAYKNYAKSEKGKAELKRVQNAQKAGGQQPGAGGQEPDTDEDEDKAIDPNARYLTYPGYEGDEDAYASDGGESSLVD